MKNGLYLSVPKSFKKQFIKVCDDNKIYWEGKNSVYGFEANLKSSAYQTIIDNGVKLNYAVKVVNNMQGEVHTIMNDDARNYETNGYSVGQKIRRCRGGFECI